MAGEELPQHAQQMGVYLRDRLAGLQAAHPTLGDVRGRGLVYGLEFVAGPGDRAPAPDLVRRLLFTAAERGLLLGRVGVYANVVRIAPPLVICEDEIDLAVGVLDGALSELGG
jgi:4-aminobutyrate aminotransferase-like enzyme